jgi:adenylate cyclase
VGIEIERKFLVRGDAWRADGTPSRIVQGYLNRDPERSVRVRTRGDRGYITVKGRTLGAARAEFEYEIPLADARQMLEELCLKPLIDKTRYVVAIGALKWEVDEFHTPRAGLVLAEVEIPFEDCAVELPPWVEREVTGDPSYYNQSMI